MKRCVPFVWVLFFLQNLFFVNYTNINHLICWLPPWFWPSLWNWGFTTPLFHYYRNTTAMGIFYNQKLWRVLADHQVCQLVLVVYMQDQYWSWTILFWSVLVCSRPYWSEIICTGNACLVWFVLVCTGLVYTGLYCTGNACTGLVWFGLVWFVLVSTVRVYTGLYWSVLYW